MRISVVLILLISHVQLFGLHTEANFPEQEKKIVKGFVFHDKNGNGVYEADKDAPLEGIAVSNGRAIVLTDHNGFYELPVYDHSIVFLIKPRNWMVPVDEDQIPRFYYVHSPDGVTETRFEGLSPTGKIPESVDFPLYPQHEPDKFDVLVLGDTQSRNMAHLHHLNNNMLAGLIGTDAAFGVTLGDVVIHDLGMFEPTNKSIAKIGIPWRYVLGNHDIDRNAKNNRDTRGGWYRTYGPTYYSFSWGPAHFIVLDNVRLVGGGRFFYKTGLGSEQMEFLRNELSRLDDEQLLVIMAHIPWTGGSNWEDYSEKKAFYEMISRFENSFSLVAHKHRHYHHFIGDEEDYPQIIPNLTGHPPEMTDTGDNSFPGNKHHHMVVAGAAFGSGWLGTPDFYGIPHATMSDGTPTAYYLLHIDGNNWKMSWRAARKPADFQMHIHAPDEISSAESPGLMITANIFNALPSAIVEMRIGDRGEWIRMERTRRIDPVREEVVERERKLGEVPWSQISASDISEHLWEARSGLKLDPGVYLIHIRSKDDWWEHEGRRIIHVH